MLSYLSASVPYWVLSFPTAQLRASSVTTKEDGCGLKLSLPREPLPGLCGSMSQARISPSVMPTFSHTKIADLPPATPADEKERRTDDERRARVLVEKKTIINLIEAFSVAVKHYLRGEEGIAYVDLYHLVKFLPSYAFPAGLVQTELEEASNLQRTASYRRAELEKSSQDGSRPSISVEPATPGVENAYDPAAPADAAQHVSYGLPLPVTSKTKLDIRTRAGRSFSLSGGPLSPRSGTFTTKSDKDVVLLPASLPPKNSMFDIFPLSLFVKCLWRKGREVQGKKAARMRAKHVVVTRNVPLEISMYLVRFHGLSPEKVH